MSEHERGAYAPPTQDAPLSFDARQPVRGARPFPATLLVSGLVLIGLIAAIFLFYRSGVREAGQPPETVGAPVSDIKSPPPPEAQPEDPAAGLQIYKAAEGEPGSAQSAPQFTPPPEQPAPRPTIVTAPPPPPAAAPTVPVSSQPAPAIKPAPLPPTPAAPVAASLKPAAQSVAAQSAAAQPLAAKPQPPKPQPSVAAPPSAPSATAKGGTAAVQIGAVSSPALADKTWSAAVALAPGLAVGKGKGVERVDKDGHVLYRTTVTGFASRGDAAAFCAKLKAAGKACFVK